MDGETSAFDTVNSELRSRQIQKRGVRLPSAQCSEPPPCNCHSQLFFWSSAHNGWTLPCSLRSCCRQKRVCSWSHCLAVSKEAQISLPKVQALFPQNGRLASTFQRQCTAQVCSSTDLLCTTLLLCHGTTRNRVSTSRVPPLPDVCKVLQYGSYFHSGICAVDKLAASQRPKAALLPALLPWFPD